MRSSTRYLVLGASVLFLWSCGKDEQKAAAPAAGDAAQTASASTASLGDRPKRKSGLWEHTVQTMGVTQTSKLCIDATTEDNVAVWGQNIQAESGCEQNSFVRTADGYSFKAVCPDGQGGKTTTVGVISGDLTSNYKMESTVSTEGSKMPQANQTMKMTMTAAWKGDCPAGMKPGDIQVAIPGMNGGATMNVGDMAKMAEGMAAKK
ncbi:MAG TPA: DUF3617 family protein [Phenylobacterium sp.]